MSCCLLWLYSLFARIMDENLYDEFGNYIGPEFDESSDEEEEEEEVFEQGDGLDEHGERLGDGSGGELVAAGDVMDVEDENRIILHEDKKYYPDADEVYPGVRTVTLDEDAQDIDEPIIKPIRVKNFSVFEKEQPVLKYSNDFVASLMNTPNLIRNVAILGNFHHGKTLFVDTLVQATQEKEWDAAKNVRYTDTRTDEQDRELSIKSCAVTLVLEAMSSKSYLLNILDCPGHINFSDESSAALRMADGAVLIVDAVEGVMMHTEKLIKQALLARVPICLVVNKVDRLILELKLPPQDAYYKLVHTIEEVNKIIAANTPVTSGTLIY